MEPRGGRRRADAGEQRTHRDPGGTAWSTWTPTPSWPMTRRLDRQLGAASVPDDSTHQGKSKLDIIRCLRRYIAREVYRDLKAALVT